MIKAVLCVLAAAAMSYGQKELVNPFETQGQWHKAALHVHTKLSDGDVNAAVRIEQYRAKGYDIVALTDHRKTNDVSGMSDANMLVISGMETHPASNAEVANHLVVLNLPAGFAFPKDANVETTAKMIKEAGGEFIYAHPYWSGHTINDIKSVKGFIAIEVYNGVTDVGNGKGLNVVHWNDCLNSGMMIPAVAVDDSHSGNHVGLGWTMIKCKERTTESVMEALRSGCFYASTGPVIEDFRISDGIAKVKCSPVKKIRLLGRLHNGSVKEAKPGKGLIESAEWKVPQKARWVRAEVIDEQGQTAWTNPIMLTAAK